MKMTIDLSNQTAVIFGAGRGIGEMIARQLAYAGAKVYVADIQQDNCEHVKQSLIAEGYQAEAATCDVRDIASIDAVLELAEQETGRLDIVVNNAGIHLQSVMRKKVLYHRYDDRRDHFLTAVYRCIRLRRNAI